MTPNQIGTRAEGEVLAALMRDGQTVLIPFGVQRYDLVFVQPDDGEFHRLQVKAGRKVKGTIRFNTSTVDHGGKRRYYTTEDIDFYGVYCDGQVYIVHVSDVGAEGCLRIDPPKNGQTAGVRWAKDYLLQ